MLTEGARAFGINFSLFRNNLFAIIFLLKRIPLDIMSTNQSFQLNMLIFAADWSLLAG